VAACRLSSAVSAAIFRLSPPRATLDFRLLLPSAAPGQRQQQQQWRRRRQLATSSGREIVLLIRDGDWRRAAVIACRVVCETGTVGLMMLRAGNRESRVPIENFARC